ncbi:uncharacterized protein LOC122293619 [Carya illinoinensis]|uniref:uncharacterized protein LOC122293619 n=1 Tax=Carya illinoinensis TaxID=32201 RepID=UPI001C717E66|nr:uncharacterized protein LOC122293619 [Carya illinoinensis]
MEEVKAVDEDMVVEEEKLSKIFLKKEEIKILQEDMEEEDEEKVEEGTKLILHKEDVEEPALFLTLKEEPNGEKSTWYLDNGASNHMTGDRSKFVELDTKVMGHVCFGDESKLEIKGKDTILFEVKNGSHKVLPNVYYIPKMKNNILSIGQLMENGCKINMEDRFLWLRDKEGNLNSKASMTRNHMFLLDMKTIEAMCLKTCVKDPSWIWHMRYGHLNFGGLRDLGAEKMVKGIPTIDHPDNLCEACLLGK